MTTLWSDKIESTQLVRLLLFDWYILIKTSKSEIINIAYPIDRPCVHTIHLAKLT